MRGFWKGALVASLCWTGVLVVVEVSHLRDRSQVESECFEESYRTKLHNQKLLKENRHITRMYDTYRRNHP